LNILAIPGAAYARAEWSRWIADCPAPYCRSALQLRRFEPFFRCWDCGAGADIVWPSNLEDIERLLMMRPDPIARNWFPGETLADLLAENIRHGIAPVPLMELDWLEDFALSICDDEVIEDTSAVLLGQPSLRQIGV